MRHNEQGPGDYHFAQAPEVFSTTTTAIVPTCLEKVEDRAPISAALAELRHREPVGVRDDWSPAYGIRVRRAAANRLPSLACGRHRDPVQHDICSADRRAGRLTGGSWDRSRALTLADRDRFGRELAAAGWRP